MVFGMPRAVFPELADTTFADSSNALGWLFSAMSIGAVAVGAVLRSSMLQSGAPDAMRGRIQGVFIVVVAGGPWLGDLRAGAMTATWTIPATMVSGGLFIVLAMVAAAIAVPNLWRYRDAHQSG